MITRDIHQERFLNGLLEGNRLQCSSIVTDLIQNNVSIKDIYENIIKTSLYQVGELWEYNKISVATEHLASSICEAILNETYAQIITTKKINKTVLLACVENEFHQVGIKMIGDVFEMNGWKTYFLGSNVPNDDLISFAKTISLDCIAISLSIYSHLPELEKAITNFRNAFPELPILVGGQAFNHGGKNTLLKHYKVIFQPDLDSTDLFIKELTSHE